MVADGDFSAPQKGNTFGKWLIRSEKAKPGFAVTLDETTFIKGGQSLKMTGSGGELALEHALRNLKPDTKYHLSFFIRGDKIKPTADAGGASVQIWDGKKSLWFPKNAYGGTMPWTKQGFSFTTDKEAKDGCVKLWMLNAEGTVWFDDVAVKEISEGGNKP